MLKKKFYSEIKLQKGRESHDYERCSHRVEEQTRFLTAGNGFLLKPLQDSKNEGGRERGKTGARWLKSR